MGRITIQYLIPVQVKSGQVEERSVPLGTWNLEGTRLLPHFSLLESGSPATLLSLCLTFFVFVFFSCIGLHCEVISTDSTSDYMYRTWLIHIHICLYIISPPLRRSCPCPCPFSPVLSFSLFLSASFPPSLLTSFLSFLSLFFPSIPEKFFFNPD